MAGLDDYQFFSTLREKDNPFWQKTADDKERVMDPMEHIRRPTEFPENLLNPTQGTLNPPPKAPAPTPRNNDLDVHKVNGKFYYSHFLLLAMILQLL